jgi:hypothetical protein
MITSLNDTLKQLCDNLRSEFGNGLKYYGEAVRSLNDGVASNFITVDNSQICAIDDTYHSTMFIIRENASVTAQTGGGLNRSLSRLVDFRLIANTRFIEEEYRVAILLNRQPKITYLSSTFDQETIAKNYYGISERNTEGAFFTASFQVLEKIECKPC